MEISFDFFFFPRRVFFRFLITLLGSLGVGELANWGIEFVTLEVDIPFAVLEVNIVLVMEELPIDVLGLDVLFMLVLAISR